MASTSLPHLLWTTAGALLGVSALVWMHTLVFSRLRNLRFRRSTETWESVLASLAEARRTPFSPASTTRLTRALDAALDDPATLGMVAEALALHPNERVLVEAVNRSRLRLAIHGALTDEDTGRQITGLRLVARLRQVELVPMVLVLTLSPDRAVARAALQALELLDPASALDLLFRSLRTGGLWAAGETLNLLRRGALDGWLATHGDNRLADVVTLLATLVQTDTEPVRLACVDLLAAIPHRSATKALGRVARSPGVVGLAAAEALSATPSGRILLAKLDLADEQLARAHRRLELGVPRP